MTPEEVMTRYEQYINPAATKLFRFMGLASVEGRGEGWTVTDTEGQSFIDCLGGYGMFALGHRHPKVVEAVERQLHAMPMSGKVLFNEPMALLAEKLAAITPGDLQYSFFCNSGTEAVEGCLKMARLATGRQEIIATDNAFHGKTFGSLTATGRDLYRTPFQPLVPGFRHVPFGDLAALEAAVTDQTAAVIVEPIQGEGGIIVPPDGYLKQVEELCHAKGALLIADEVQTGMGRTGRLFAMQKYGVTPDIVCLAKAFGGGMPLGAFVARHEVMDTLQENPALGHITTFGGHPVCCAAGLAALNYLVDNKVVERVETKGALYEMLLKDHPAVREIRRSGLLLAVELGESAKLYRIMELFREAGILSDWFLFCDTAFRISPPLTISEDEVRESAALIRSCLDRL